MKITYKDSGVDKNAGYESVERIKKHAEKTYSHNVLTSLGAFAAAYRLPQGMNKPVLISGTDGVGTKLKVARMAGVHDSVGIDLVAMCVNDILCQGAKPLFFLDYIACGKNDPQKTEQIVKGIASGCMMAECSLIGGETAEMPGMYEENDYDLAGFAVGVAEEDNVITGKETENKDILIGLASSGIHSNGYSLVRKLFFEIGNYKIDSYISEIGKKLYEELLIPTKIYVKSLMPLIEKKQIVGISHITGGGFYENIPRMLPKGLSAVINKNSIEVPAVFNIMAKLGNIAEREMFSTFNMGIGMVVCVKKKHADSVLNSLISNNEKAYIIGTVEKGSEGVVLK